MCDAHFTNELSMMNEYIKRIKIHQSLRFILEFGIGSTVAC